MLKRERERARIEKAKQKAARRVEKAQRGPERPQSGADVDPDLAGIVAGPQPLAEWQIDEAPEDTAEEDENTD